MLFDVSSFRNFPLFVVIGIDPGSRLLGYSVLLFKAGEFNLLKLGSFTFTGKLGEKLFTFFQFFSSLYDSLILEFCCLVFFSIESQFVLKNFRSSFVLVSFNSVLLLIVQQKSSLLFEFSPAEVRKLICSDPFAKKDAVAKVLSELFSISFASSDESDSLAISFSGALRFLHSTL